MDRLDYDFQVMFSLESILRDEMHLMGLLPYRDSGIGELKNDGGNKYHRGMWNVRIANHSAHIHGLAYMIDTEGVIDCPVSPLDKIDSADFRDYA